MRRLGMTCLFILLCTAGCTPDQTGEAETLLPPLTITGVGPTPLVPGTQLVIEGEGFLPAEVVTLTVRLRGTVDGAVVELSAAPMRLGDDRLQVDVGGALEDALIQDGGSFSGELVVERQPVGTAPFASASLEVDLPTATALAPGLTSLAPDTLYPGEMVTLSGEDFLHPSEGIALVALDGELVIQSPPESRTVAGLVVPAAPPVATARDQLTFVLTPDILGIRPARFSGTVQVINQMSSGEEYASQTVDLVDLELARPYLDEVAPLEASRGQRVDFMGRGLLPADGLLQAATLLLLEGSFKPWRGPEVLLTGVDALALFPDESPDNTLASVVLRVHKNVDGELEGLGLIPGVFDGIVTPMVVAGPDSARGVPFELQLTVLAPRQVVHLKLLKAFDDALDEFGMRAVKDAVVDRLLEVVGRDYAGINIEFRTAWPEDFVEFAIAEIGGRDPNGTGLFGLDNTPNKDVGNLRFDDVIGGFNAETRARGYAGYGGIFVAEFMSLSPSLSDSMLTSPRFDDVFGPFAPALGGKPIKDGEAGGGSRGEAIELAIRTLGNLIGNTVTHEVGHSLGLAAIDGHFHNLGDNPNWIMDAGSARPFEERAELDGQGPEVFSPFNREYLEQILPMDP